MFIFDPLRHFKCLPAKFEVANFDNGIESEISDNRDVVVGYCEAMCWPDSCDDLQSHDFQNHDHCQRKSFFGSIYIGDNLC